MHYLRRIYWDSPPCMKLISYMPRWPRGRVTINNKRWALLVSMRCLTLAQGSLHSIAAVTLSLLYPSPLPSLPFIVYAFQHFSHPRPLNRLIGGYRSYLSRIRYLLSSCRMEKEARGISVSIEGRGVDRGVIMYTR